MELVKNILTSGLGMGTGAISDTVKLVVIGGTVETARRVASSSWTSFIDSFFLTAHFTQEDVPYDWIMHWLSKQPAWGRSREFDITTANAPRGGLDESAGDVEDDNEDSALGRRRKLVKFMPAYDTTHTIYYRGHWLRITRSKRSTDYGHCREIKISVVARNNTVIKQLVLEAKKMYEKDAEHRIHVFIPDTWGCWRWNGSRQKRPLDSVVLESSVKDMIVADCKDFMNSEDWYAERGIPYRRGYLLYGVPGSGKTSLIHALAGELGLDIYALSLSAKGMSDNTLTQLMGRIPTRCIVLLEDLDASFTHSTSRDSKSTGVPSAQTSTQAAESDGNSLTLSGLLNAIDGVTAPEGRILVATTNHIDRLDEALRRPGRMDVWINFKHATRWQAEGIFKRFFPYVPKARSGSDTPNGSTTTTTDPTITLSADVMKKTKRTSLTGIPLLDEDELETLAKKFAQSIPEDEISVAGLQGFLLKNKSRPRECVEEVGQWVIDERERRERLKKEKEEKERKEKEEAEKAEKEEKEKKEKEEKEKEKEATKDAATTSTTTTTTTTESTPTLDVAAARKALRRAKKAARAASSVSSPTDTGLPTPPAEGTPIAASEKSSSDESTTDSDSDDEDDASSTSSTSSSSSEEEEKKKKSKSKKEKKTASAKGKDKWVAVKKADSTQDKTDATAATAATDSATTTSDAAAKEETEESTEEDLSSVDALVDAATKSSPAPAEAAAAA